MVDLIGKKVTYKPVSFLVAKNNRGTGTVVEQQDGKITVQFSKEKISFSYPDAFENNLILEDEDSGLLEQIRKEIAEKKAAEEAKKEEERIRIAKSIEADAAASKKGSKSNKFTPADRSDGKPKTYIVFQGKSYQAEREDQFIGVSTDATKHHHLRIKELKAGDVVFHCDHKKIASVSLVKAPFETTFRPGYEDCWLVQCEYHDLKTPLDTNDYKDTLAEYSGVQYAPFSKTGKGIQGYLFELDPRLAAFFLDEMGEEEDIPNLDFVQFIKEFK